MKGFLLHITFFIFVLSGKSFCQDFKADTSQKCLSGGFAIIRFTYSGPAGNTFKWDFGDGGTSSIKDSASHNYTQSGTFTVTLTVDSNAPISKTVQIFAEPTSNITSTAATLCSGPITVNFLSNASPDVTTYLWDFADGSKSSLPNPTHFYNSGNYKVSLVVTNNGGCKTSKEYNLNITQDITGIISNSSTNICNQAGKVDFDDLSTSTGFPVNSWIWDFGDAGNASTKSPSHVYAVSDTYIVKLIVKNQDGCVDTVSKELIVTISNVSNKIKSATKTSVCENDTLSFSAENNLYSMSWDFGGGNFGNSQNVSTSYTTAGSYKVVLTSTNTFGCSFRDTFPTPITVLSAPIPQYAWLKDTTCTSPIPVSFTDTSQNSVNWTWDFGDGQTSTSQNPKNFYDTIGTYLVTHTVTYANSCVTTRSDSVKITFTDIVANFSISPATSCIGDSVQFNDITGSGVVGWKWDFGDPGSGVNNTSTLKDAKHAFSKKGSYTITLTITDDKGCSDPERKFNAVIVGQKVNPDFTADPKIGCIPHKVQFNNLTTSNPDSTIYFWSFGDGATSDEYSPEHTYDAVGDFDVLLVVMYRGCPDSIFYDTLIHVEPPDAIFLPKPLSDTISCTLPHTVQFENLSIGVDSAFWDFGDGTTYIGKDEDPPPHIYLTEGSYSTKLIVWNFTNGCSDTLELGDIIRIASPVAIFNYDTNQVYCAPVTINFENLSTPTWGLSIWNFGDSTEVDSSFTSTHSFTFNEPGAYVVKLKNWLPNNCQDSMIKTIIIGGTTANYFADTLQGCAPLTVQFTDSSYIAQNIVKWFWDFGDDVTDTVQNPVHTYNSDGFYTISLTVTDIGGCVSQKIRYNYVTVGTPGGNFSSDKTMVCAGAGVGGQVSFTSFPTSTVIAYNWDFGDGQTSTVKNPFHIFDKAGLYTVKLVINYASGCPTIILKNDFITVVKPVADFVSNDTLLFCAPQSVMIKDLSIDTISTIVRREWNFGNGVTSSLNIDSANTTYLVNGFFDVKLVVTNTMNCTDTIIKDEYIKIFGPVAKFSVSDTSGCVPFTVVFTDSSERADIYRWDFGDGGSSSLKNPVYTYTNPGINPTVLEVEALVQGQSCLATFGPVKFYANPVPVAGFGTSQLTNCNLLNAPFTDSSSQFVTKWHYDFGDGDTSNLQNPTHGFLPGKYTVKQNVETEFGCKDSLTRTDYIIVYPAPVAKFFPDKYTSCDTITVFFEDISTTDSLPIVTWLWNFGDGTTDTVRNPKHFYGVVGKFDVSLSVINNRGCFSTYTSGKAVIIADATPAEFAGLNYASVISPSSVKLFWKFSTSTDLDNYHIFVEEPYGSNNFSLLDSTKNTTYIHDTITPGLRPYCYYVLAKDTCQHYSKDIMIHCTVKLDVSVSQQRNGLNLNWTPYVGWDASLQSYNIYRDTSGNLTLLDNVPATDTNYTDRPLCDDDYNYQIEAIKLNNEFTSTSNIDTGRPDYQYLSTSIINTTVVDNEFIQTTFQINDSIHNGDYFIFHRKADGEIIFTENYSRPTKDETVFDDRSTIVDSLSYIYEVAIVDTCGYISTYSNMGKSILLLATRDEKKGRLNYDITLVWTPYKEWKNGVSKYIIELKKNEVFSQVGEVNGNLNSFIYEYQYEDLPEYIFRVYAINNDTVQTLLSYSNETKIILPPLIFVPNAFTLNGDNLNDRFEISTSHIDKYNLKIFNRWGIKIWETNERYDFWDGTYKGKPVILDAYMWLIQATGYNGKAILKYGSVTVLR